MSTNNTPGKIYPAMMLIMKDVEAIAKERKNEAQNFHFRGIDDVYYSLHNVFARHGVITVPVIERIEHDRYENAKKNLVHHTRLTVKFRFTAIDGSYVEAIGAGEATDFGDKSTAKCLSAAHKSVLIQTFLVPVWQMEDQDADSTVDPLEELRRIDEERARAAVVAGKGNGELELPEKDAAALLAKRREAEALAATSDKSDTTLITPAVQQEIPLEKTAEEKPKRTKKTETPATLSNGDWREHVVNAVPVADLQGKRLVEVSKADIERIYLKWVSKHTPEDFQKKGAHCAVEAKAFHEAYQHHFPQS